MDLRAGRVMQAIAVAGVVVATVGCVVAWRFLGELQRNVDQSLVIGEDAATTLTETIDVADSLLVSLDDGLATIGASLDTIDGTISDVAGLASTTSELAGTLPDSLEGIDGALDTLEGVGETVDTTLRALSAVPFGPDYDPQVSLPEVVSDLRGSIEPIGRDLGQISTELEDFAAGSDDLRARLDSFAGDLAESRGALEDTDVLLDDYRAAALDAGQLASSSRSDLDTSMTWMRVVLVLLAALVVVGQFVPWWLGSHLVERSEPTIG